MSDEKNQELEVPEKERSCTDVICLLLFVIFLAMFLILGVYGFTRGDPRTILYPVDSFGHYCGSPIDELTQEKPFLFYFDITKCIGAPPFTLAHDCGSVAICLETCPKSSWVLDPTDDTIENRQQMICRYQVDPLASPYKDMTLTDLIREDLCAFYYLKSDTFLDRCIPGFSRDILENLGNISVNGNEITLSNGKTLDGKTIKKALHVLDTALGIIGDGVTYIKDVYKKWPKILLCIGLAAGLSFIWLLLMRFLSGHMVWISLLGFLALFIVLTVLSGLKCSRLYNLQGNNTAIIFTTSLSYYAKLPETWLVITIACGLVFIIILFIVIFLRKRIQLAIACIKATSDALKHLISAIFWPIIPLSLKIGIIAFWLFTTLNLASISSTVGFYGNTTVNNNSLLKYGKDLEEKVQVSVCSKTLSNFTVKDDICKFFNKEASRSTFWFIIYVQFLTFWTINFVGSFSEIVLSSCFSRYYWSKPLPKFIFLKSLWSCLRYHLGSVAFGSLIIAIFQTLRALLEVVENSTKKENKFAKCISCCCKCCLWCLERVLKYITRNAYIIVGSSGANFCKGGRVAMKLLLSNAVRAVVVDKVSDFIILLSKVFIVGVSLSLALYQFPNQPGPIIAVIIGGYIVSSLFLHVYSMGVDTIFLCFLQDLDENDGSEQKPYAMPKELMILMDKTNETDNKKDDPLIE